MLCKKSYNFILFLACIVLGLSGCQKRTDGVSVSEGVRLESTGKFKNGPCSETGAKFVETHDLEQGYSYRKCWSENTRHFATEIYKDGKRVELVMIPTILDVDDSLHRYGLAVDTTIRNKINESPDLSAFEDRDEIGRVKTVDLNFDGKLDILVYKGKYKDPILKIEDKELEELEKLLKKLQIIDRGTGLQKYYSGYLWNDQSRRFEFVPVLHTIASPEVDTENKSIQVIRDTYSPVYRDRLVFEYGEDDIRDEEEKERAWEVGARYYREFAELKCIDNKCTIVSAVNFISCGDYSEKTYTRSGNPLTVVGGHSKNTTCVYSEYDYPNNEEHRVKAYVPLEELSPGWIEYIKKYSPRKAGERELIQR